MKSLEICTRKRINEIDCVADENFENFVNLYIKFDQKFQKFAQNLKKIFNFLKIFPEYIV